MGRNKLIEKAMLLPMSKLYGMGVAVRNRMFEWHLLKQHTAARHLRREGTRSA